MPSVDASAVVVQRRDFVGALKSIVPSSHRAAAAHARPLAPAHLAALGPKLGALVRGVKAAFGPATAVMAATAKAAAVGGGGGGGGGGEGAGAGAAVANGDGGGDDDFLDDDEGDDSDEEMVNVSAAPHAPGAANTSNADPENNALSPSARLLAGASSKGKGASSTSLAAAAAPPPPPPPRAARAVVCGPAGCGASDVAAALLAALEGLPLHSLGLPCLLSDGGGGGMHGADEALVRAFAAARRAAPSVLFLPQADLWWSAAPRVAARRAEGLLGGGASGCPVLLVASADCGVAELPAALAALLGVGSGGGREGSSSPRLLLRLLLSTPSSSSSPRPTPRDAPVLWQPLRRSSLAPRRGG